jgi:nucleotide-binding universal stress UspA family protein
MHKRALAPTSLPTVDRMVLGSVASAVVATARCAVLTVRGR